jgi:hypothetical protein
MKKQKQETINPKDMTEMVDNHRMKQVSPPQQANRGMDGRYAVSRAEAAQYWFKAAKEQHPDNGFLGVSLKGVEAKEATGKFENNRPAEAEMLYKGKKKEIVKE